MLLGAPTGRGGFGRPRVARVMGVGRVARAVGGGLAFLRMLVGVGVVAVAEQQIEGPVRVAGDTDGFGPADPDRVVVAVVGQRVGEPVHQGQEDGDVAGVGAGDQHPVPVAGLGGPHVPVGGGFPGPGLVAGLVDMQQRGVQHLLEPSPRHQLQMTGQQPVDLTGAHRVQVRGGLGDPPGLPRMHLPGGDPGPGPGQPVPQVHRVPDQPPCAADRGLEHHRQFRRAGFGDQRAADRAHRDHPLDPHRRSPLFRPCHPRARHHRQRSARRPRRRRSAASGSRPSSQHRGCRRPAGRGRRASPTQPPTDPRTCIRF